MNHPHNQDPQMHALPPELRDIEVTPEDMAIFTSPEMDEDMRKRLEGVLAASLLMEHERPEQKLSGDEEDDFVQSLRKFKEQFHIPADAKVIYPGSATHVGVARVFGKGSVVHVDPDELATKVLGDMAMVWQPRVSPNMLRMKKVMSS